jgi:hypothetical protein
MTRWKKILLLIASVVAVLIGLAVYWLREFSRDMSAEYGTAQTIGKVTDYVESHNGNWPRNWDEIEPWPGAREFVVMPFDVDIDRLVDDPDAIHSTIVPITGPYNVYPHAKADLELLRRTLIKFHGPNMKAEGVLKLPPQQVDRETETGAASR